MSVDTTTNDAPGTLQVRAAGFVVPGLVLLVAVALLLKLRLAFVLNVNWDEYFYLSHVHQYLRGELTAQFQVFHVHLFTWLPLVADGEVPQIIAARLVMYGLGLGSCGFTYLIARKFLNHAGALFAVLAYLAISNLVEHGTSFRYDPIGAFLFLAALCLLFYRPGGWRAAVGAGILMALAMMVTIKSAIHLATIAAIFLVLLLPADRRRGTWLQILAFGASIIVGFAALYGLHRLSLPSVPADAASFAATAADKALIEHGLLPRRWELINHLVRNPIVWGLMLNGLALLALDAFRRREGALRQLLMIGAFSIPLLSVLAYRNAFPYFYVFIISPAVIASAIVVDRLWRVLQTNGNRWALAEIGAFTGAVFISFVIHFQTNAGNTMIAGRQIADTVHRMFPHPVPYIDGFSMIATFPKVGFFMSTWGMETYRRDDHPVLAEAIARRAPVFVLANKKPLSDALSGRSAEPEHSLLEADRAALAQNYVHHWGMIYVAGKTLEFATPSPVRFEILIPGIYTVEAADRVTIDGAPCAAGQAVNLGVGRHVMVSDAAPGTVTLRWGERLFRPTEAPSSEPLFAPFR
jgi:hypothetical protein